MKKSLIPIFIFLIFSASKNFAQTRKIIYEEHFTSNTKKWIDGENEIGVGKFANGKYLLENKRVNSTASVTAPQLKLPADNYSVELNSRWKKNETKGMHYAYGIVLDNYSIIFL